MKISINAVLAHCILFYFQIVYFFIFFAFIGTCKKDVICVKFGTPTQTTI